MSGCSILRRRAARLFFLPLLLVSTVTAMAAGRPGLMLATVYDGQRDIGEFWVSEKLDGVRAYWNGQRFVSRQGNPIRAPGWFIEALPDQPLDGELWMGRGRFAELSGAVRRQEADDAQWRRIRYMVFDLPASPEPFGVRLRQLRSLLASGPPAPHIQPVDQLRMPDREALLRYLHAIVAEGGEGLMLHRDTALYRPGRSSDLLKMKTYLDAEALVVAHIAGEGKYQGALGALLVETPEGLRFRIGTGLSERQRWDPPPVGSTITYRYTGTTHTGIPRFASFLRLHEPY